MAEEATAQGDTTAEADAGSTLLEESTSESTEETQETGEKQETTATEETKTLLGEGDEEGSKEETKEKGEAAPESYADFVVPEGTTVDEKLVEHMSPVMRDAGLSQEGAQKLVDGWGVYVQQVTAAHEQELAQKKSEMRKEIQAVPNFKETVLSPAKHALAVLASPADQTRIISQYGDDPAVLRLLARVGEKLREDKIPEGPVGKVAPVDPTSVLANAFEGSMKNLK